MPFPRWLRLCWTSTHFCAHCVGTLALWTLWLVLSIILVLQAIIATVREVPVPGFLLRELETRLAAAGLSATFGSATVDPAGHVLVRDLQLHLGRNSEAIARAGMLYLEVDPWALLLREVNVTTLEVDGGELLVPAMLSPSGQNEPLVSDLTGTLAIDERAGITVRRLTARAGPFAVQASGRLPQWRPSPTKPVTFDFAAAYPRFAGALAARLLDLPRLEEPRLKVTFAPEGERGMQFDVRAEVDAAEIPARWIRLPEPLQIQEAALTSELHWQPGAVTPLRLDFTAASAELEGRGRADHVVSQARGTLSLEQRAVHPERFELAARNAVVDGVELRTPHVRLLPSSRTAGEAHVRARAFDTMWALAADGDIRTGDARVTVDTQISPALLAWVGGRVGRPFQEIFQAAKPPALQATVQVEHARPVSALARLQSGPVVARRVALDQARGEFRWSGSRLQIEEILLRSGPSEARGRYEMDTATKDFRILLQGRLQPAAIDGWFKDWWPRFWSRFEFNGEAPAADVEVSGRWGDVRQTQVFVAADGQPVVLQGAAFDRVRTRLFVRPHYTDVLGFIGDRAGRSARGSFTRSYDPAARNWSRLTFDVHGDTDLDPAPALFGDVGRAITAPFVFSSPPQLHVRGSIEGPASARAGSADVTIGGEATGDWTFYAFPLRDLSFHAELTDDILLVDNIAVSFAGGRGSGRAELRGMKTDRRLAFDLALNDARLGESIRTLETWSSQRRAEPVPPTSAFQQRVAAGRLDLSLTAVGNYDDPYSLEGEGNAVVTGAELGEINLLGILSTLLRRTVFNFTTLQLDTVQSNFDLHGRRLDFEELRVTGPRAVIDAEGSYRLDTQTLSFLAKVRPFDGSNSLLGATLGAVFTPLTNVLEVKLGGTLKQPNWAFVYGPTTLFRALSGSSDRIDEEPAPPKPPLRRP